MMNIQEILENLPQRFPFLMIDRVIEYVPGQRLVAIKNVTSNEPYFVGHFPKRMVMPGVMILEALAQAGCILASRSLGEKLDGDIVYYLAGIDDARFKKIVEPGDQLHLTIEAMSIKKNVCKVRGIATVDDQLVCSAEFLSARGTFRD